MSFSGPYQYGALARIDSIRLLKLKPASSSDETLRCELFDSNLSAAPDYEALSYVWGKDECPQRIELPSGCLKITDSLASALRALRSNDKPRQLWVDAVCINQCDHVEKAHQVSQMAKIYGKAARVLAWLGESSDATLNMTLALDLAQKSKGIGLLSPRGENRETIRKWAYGDSEKVDWIMGVMDAVDDAGFFWLYQSSWFTRMWIVQEALLAKRLILHFGTVRLDWEGFEKVMILIQAVSAAIRLPMTSREVFVKYAWALIEVRDHWLRSNSHPVAADHITYYMHQLRRRSCKDDRDRVFALLGLLPESTGLNLHPDYSKTVAEVYTELAAAQLRLGNIGVLYDAGLWKRKYFQPPESRGEGTSQPSRSDYLPTWAPNYRQDTSFMELAEMRFGGYFGADSRVPPIIDLSKESYRLTTQATLIDIVTCVQPALFVHHEGLRANDALMLLTCRRFCMDLKRTFDSQFVNRPCPSHEDSTKVFAYSLVGGGTDKAYIETFDHGVNHAPLDPVSLWNIYCRHCIAEDGEIYTAMQREARLPLSPSRKTIKGVGMEFYSSINAEASIAWNYHHHIVNILRRHWFFITDDGYTGLAPLDTKVETDVLAFIDGANIPFVLRDLGEDASDFLLVGPCYIYGLMDGEAVKQNTAFDGGTIQII